MLSFILLIFIHLLIKLVNPSIHILLLLNAVWGHGATEACPGYCWAKVGLPKVVHSL